MLVKLEEIDYFDQTSAPTPTTETYGSPGQRRAIPIRTVMPNNEYKELKEMSNHLSEEEYLKKLEKLLKQKMSRQEQEEIFGPESSVNRFE